MMAQAATFPLDEFLRTDRLAHVWCPGCGLGIILNSLARALEEAEVNMDEVAMVSGIGCAGRAAGYVTCDSFHATHGRAIPFAIGLKAANPRLKVIVFSGDGDLFAIGGNHFLHAAARNAELLVICANNFHYAMTGGQSGPTTPLGARTADTPQGCDIEPLNLAALAAALGATYVARWTVAYPRRLTNSIKKGLRKEGFAFIEVISPCPELYGKMNRLGTAFEMLKRLISISRIRHHILAAEATFDPDSRIICGEFVDRERPGLIARLRDRVKRGERC